MGTPIGFWKADLPGGSVTTTVVSKITMHMYFILLCLRKKSSVVKFLKCLNRYEIWSETKGDLSDESESHP